MNSSPRAAILIVAALLFFPPSASADFYTLRDRWDKTQANTHGRAEAVDDAFRSALFSRAAASGEAPAPTVLRRTLADIRASAGSVEITAGQTLLVQADSAIIKFASTEVDVVSLELVPEDTLSVHGESIGRTFVHLWDASGRTTFDVRVTPQRLAGPSYEAIHRDAVEKTRPFKVKYQNQRHAFYRGPKYRERNRTSLDFDQTIGVEGDTPYGSFSSHAQIQRAGTNTEYILTDIQARLEDGRVGPFRDFNLTVGDAEVRPGLIVFSQGRVRGYDLDHRDEDGRVKLESFYGRELTSIVGTLAPLFGSQKRSKDSFLSGNLAEIKLGEASRVKAGFFTGSGRHRADELNREGAGVSGDLTLGPHWRALPELNFDNETTAQKNALEFRTDKWRVRGEYRNISEKFQSLLGVPSNQGELGYRADVQGAPHPQWAYAGTFDIFRDRRIPNPDDLDAENKHTDMSLTWTPAERSSVIASYQDFDDTGRIGPTRQRSLGLQFNQGIDLWGQKATFTTRYHHRKNRALNTAQLNYDVDQLAIGLYTRIFWGIVLSVSKEWNWLEEREPELSTVPQVLTYNLSYSRQVFDTPFFFDANLRIRDEEQTEATNSFMTGEDSTEISLGLTYRKYENWEFFVNGRFANYDQESLNVTEPRIEAEVITGARYVHDTGVRWMPSGHFEGIIFKDLNADGAHQPEEPGWEGIGVELSDGRRAVSDASGRYAFRSVSGKRAVLTLDVSNVPTGFVPSSSVRREEGIEAGRTRRVDFGIVPRSEITGIIFNDLDANGRFDLSDVPVRGVRVTLEDGKAARSNQSGVYVFSQVVAGEHTVTLDLSTLPEGYLPRVPLKKSLMLFEAIRYEHSFPVKAVRAVTGRVFVDSNRNGYFDAGEKAFEGAKVMLGERAAASDVSGRYLFEEVGIGEHALSVDVSSLPPGWRAADEIFVRFSAEPATLTDRDLAVTPWS